MVTEHENSSDDDITICPESSDYNSDDFSSSDLESEYEESLKPKRRKHKS